MSFLLVENDENNAISFILDLNNIQMNSLAYDHFNIANNKYSKIYWSELQFSLKYYWNNIHSSFELQNKRMTISSFVANCFLAIMLQKIRNLSQVRYMIYVKKFNLRKTYSYLGDNVQWRDVFWRNLTLSRTLLIMLQVVRCLSQVLSGHLRSLLKLVYSL